MAAENIIIIPKGAKVEGKINFAGSIAIDGEVNGEIKSGGTLNINRDSKVKADIETENAVVSGYFEGVMNASGQVDIKSTGKFVGDLVNEKSLLTIEKGGLFKGKSIVEESRSGNQISQQPQAKTLPGNRHFYHGLIKK